MTCSPPTGTCSSKASSSSGRHRSLSRSTALGWTITVDDGRPAVAGGVAAGAFVLSFTPEQFSDWAQDLQSVLAMDVGRTLVYRNGGAYEVALWDALWRALLLGWPVVDHDLAFVDRAGEPLDLGQIFTPRDDPRDVAHFLREAGFLHLRGWVDPGLAAEISREFDAAEPAYVDGDGRSWWADFDDGSHRCVRMQQFLPYSPSTATMLADPRWEQLRVTVGGDDALEQSRQGDSVVEALIKPPGLVAGVSNLPFHRDCHFGKHGYKCSGVDVGITVTDSGGEYGQLQVVAGSHRVAVPVSIANTDPYLPVVPIATQAGDCTVHLSCTLHESTAPISRTRKVMYAPFKLAEQPDAGPPLPDRDPGLRNRVYEIVLREDGG